MCQHSHYTGVRNPRIVTIRRKFERGVLTLALHGKNGESAGNCHLMDEESTGGGGFHRELPAYLRRFRPVRLKFAKNPLNGNNANFKTNLNMKTSLSKNKPDPVLLGTSYLSN
jgi:hypothetical protein